MDYRFAQKRDLPNLLVLYKQFNFNEDDLSIEKANSIWEAIDSNSSIKYFIALDGLKIVSTCNMTIIPNLTRNGRSFAIIENVITDEEYRRKGIGKQILVNAIEYAKSNNCYKVLLLSSISRKESHAFYESIGFNGNSKKGFEIRF